MNGNKVAKWFIHKNPSLSNGFIDENITVNKLLYFSELMFFSVFKERMISDSFVAFPKGPVVNKVYVDYRYNGLNNYVDTAIDIDDSRASKVLEIINFVYGRKSPCELVDESHTHNIWSEVKLKIPNNPQVIFENISKDVINYFNDLYSVYKNFEFALIGEERISGNVYFYNKNVINMTDELIEELSGFDKFDEPQFIEDFVEGEVVLS